MSRRLLSRLLIVLIVLAGLSGIIHAQGGPLVYGTVLSDTANPGTPIIYTFSGNANDIVTIYAIGSSNLQATLALSNSSGQPLGFSNGDALTPMPNDVRITALLPSNDTYIVTFNNAGDAPGTFTLSLTASPAGQAFLSGGSSTLTIAPGTPAQQYRIPANSDGSQELTLRSLMTGVGFSAQLYSGDGLVLASVAGGLNRASFELRGNNTGYLLTLEADDPSIGASIEVILSSGAGAPPPVVTEEAQPADPNVCTITANAVNVRSGPGTNYGVVGSLNDGNQMIASGQNNGWYNGTYNGQSAWVASGVVTASGNCANLPFVDAPPPPAPPVTTEETDTQQTTNTQPSPTAVTQDQQQQQPTNTPQPTATTTVPFQVVSVSCRWFQNDGATVDFHVTGPAGATFRIDVRQGSTTYSADRTLNDQGFLNANQRFGQAGNSNYTAYIVYNNADLASADC